MALQSNVKTVLAQTSSVSGDFRLRKLQHVAGENKTVTVHKESHCSFHVDLRKCYFSPRLFHERVRVAEHVGSQEIVVNMFAGVGCFSVLIAKKSTVGKVYSIDINPTAIQYMKKNIRVNRVCGRMIAILGDAKNVIETRLHHKADRVLMLLPQKALDYLPYALLALKNSGGWIHYYDFEHAKKGENAVEKVRLKVSERLESLGVPFENPSARIVRSTGPNWHQIVLDIKVTP
jgi:tRNA (guanine37-N1)-methyltransferase